MTGVTLVLTVISFGSFLYHRTKRCVFFDDHFFYKCKYLLAPALFFSFNIVFTNIGIQLTSVDLHVLLRSTEIIWFVLLTPIFTNDTPTKQAVFAAFIVTIGATSLVFSDMDAHNISFPALIINILSALFSALQSIFLRRAIDKLLELELNHATMGITCLQMLLSLIFILPASLIAEKPKALRALSANYGAMCNSVIVAIGIVVTLLCQWNVVALTTKIEPVLIGTLQQSKGILKYIVSLMLGGTRLRICGCQIDLICANYFGFDGHFAALHIIGVSAIILGMAYYGRQPHAFHSKR